MTCSRLGGARRKVCLGDLDTMITLQSRAITAPVYGTPDFTEAFVTSTEVWASLQTINGKTFFNGLNQQDVALTHAIFIEYRSDVTAETWILYDGRRFDIVSVEDLDERKEFMRLWCVDKGMSQL